MGSPALWMVLGTLVVGLVLLSRFARVSFGIAGGVSLHDLHATSMEAHQRVGDHLRANHGGDPATLGLALRGLLPSVREIAARHGQTLDDDLLRIVIASSIAAHHIASRAQAEEAVDEALRREREAA